MNKAEFEARIKEVDKLLQDHGVTIPMRPIRAVGEFSKSLQCNLPLSAPFGRPVRRIDDYYEGESLAAHVLEWMDRRYGKRLAMADGNLGVIAVDLRGDAWKMLMPWVLGGDAKFYPGWHRVLLSRESRENILRGDKLNVLDLIDDLTQDLVNDLTEPEMNSLVKSFVQGYQVHRTFAIKYAQSQLARAVHNDINNSARDALDPRVYGWSRFESQQAAEKSLKFFLDQKGITFEWTHSLKDLHAQCEAGGLSGIEPDDVDAAHIAQGVRYNPLGHSVKAALRSHAAALTICSAVALAVG